MFTHLIYSLTKDISLPRHSSLQYSLLKNISDGGDLCHLLIFYMQVKLLLHSFAQSGCTVSKLKIYCTKSVLSYSLEKIPRQGSCQSFLVFQLFPKLSLIKINSRIKCIISTIFHLLHSDIFCFILL